jgi:hypothetical protein
MSGYAFIYTNSRPWKGEPLGFIYINPNGPPLGGLIILIPLTIDPNK